jgi:hypothetical protein
VEVEEEEEEEEEEVAVEVRGVEWWGSNTDVADAAAANLLLSQAATTSRTSAAPLWTMARLLQCA